MSFPILDKLPMGGKVEALDGSSVAEINGKILRGKMR